MKTNLSDLLSTPQRWRREQLMASTMLVPPLPLGQRRWGGQGFFYADGHGHARNARYAHDDALGVTFAELVSLRVAYGPGHRGGHKPGLVPAGLVLVFDVACRAAVAPDMSAAASGAQMVSGNHKQQYTAHLKLDHRLKLKRTFQIV